MLLCCLQISVCTEPVHAPQVACIVTNNASGSVILAQMWINVGPVLECCVPGVDANFAVDVMHVSAWACTVLLYYALLLLMVPFHYFFWIMQLQHRVDCCPYQWPLRIAVHPWHTGPCCCSPAPGPISTRGMSSAASLSQR